MRADCDTDLVLLVPIAFAQDFAVGLGGEGAEPDPDPGPGTAGTYLLWRRRRGAWRHRG